MQRIAIVGSGLIGRSWAMVFARAGRNVALYDGVACVVARAREIIETGLTELAAQGMARDVPAILARIRVATSLQDAVDGADLVQENTPETLESKLAIFAELDRLAGPATLLASSTSSIVASRFTEQLTSRARCFIAHPVNPPHLMPLVELVGAPWTAPEVIERARAFYEAVDQVPIIVRREVDGFILNRLQAVLLAEAFRLVGEGYVSPQDLDKTMTDGLGLRWAFMGPFDTIELNAPGGVPDYSRRYGPTMERLSGAEPGTIGAENLTRVMAQWGTPRTPAEVAERMQWRDKQLAALRMHKQAQPPG